MTKLLKFWYLLTAYWPRKLPADQAELSDMQQILINYYGLKDRADVWHIVMAHIGGTHGKFIRKPYAFLVNAAKRLDINKLAYEQRQFYEMKLRARLKELAQEVSKDETSQDVQ